MPTTPPAAEPRIQYSSLRQGPGDYSTHYSGLRGVRHRWIGVLLRDCAAQERCHRRGRGLKQSGRINDLPVVVFMDGLEATRQVKAAPETRSIPIIALTANALVEDREKALAAGATISTPSQSNYRDCRKRSGISWGQAIRRAEVLFSPPLSAHVPAFRCKPFIACPPDGRILEKHGVTRVKPLRHIRKLGYVVTAAVAV